MKPILKSGMAWSWGIGVFLLWFILLGGIKQYPFEFNLFTFGFSLIWGIVAFIIAGLTHRGIIK